MAINCAALVDNLLESEMFGFERGAFSNAVAAKPGLIELADGGTLFLDEVGEMSAPNQAKLLRVVQERSVQRVGATAPINVDVRFISATNRRLRAAVENGAFREDLYHRLVGFWVELPALRNRKSEIPSLARLFVTEMAERMDRAPPALDPLALAALIEHDWPGNIRELKNVVECAVVLSDGELFRADDLRIERADAAPLFCSGDPERRAIIDALARSAGHQGLAAKELGLTRRTLTNKLIKHRIDGPRKKRG